MCVKNLIVNVFKTLFFFDFILILTSVIPAIKFKNDNILIFNTQLTFFLIVGVFTYFYLNFVEKKKLKLSEKKGKFKALFAGVFSGLLIPVIYAVTMKIYNFSKYEGINKTENIWYYLLALFLNALWIELLLRCYLFSLYKKYYGFILTTIFTTLLFISMNHEILKMNKIYLWVTLLFNVYMCFIREKFNSIIANIFANFSFSFAGIILLGYNSPTLKYPQLLNYKFEGKEKIVGGEHLLMGSKVTLIAFSVILSLWLIIKYKLWQYFTIKKFKSYILSIKLFFVNTIYNIKNFKYKLILFFKKFRKPIRRHK